MADHVRPLPVPDTTPVTVWIVVGANPVTVVALNLNVSVVPDPVCAEAKSVAVTVTGAPGTTSTSPNEIDGVATEMAAACAPRPSSRRSANSEVADASAALKTKALSFVRPITVTFSGTQLFFCATRINNLSRPVHFHQPKYHTAIRNFLPSNYYGNHSSGHDIST